MQKRRLHLSKKDKKIAGVCGGIAEHFDFDPTLVRIIWVLLTIMTSTIGLMGVLIYIVCWAVMPMDDEYEDLR
ncbi:MAG: PspC domain-containing protein [Epulopiscium sp.]|nr:PspC domain-containing protein [Candidatus Epulonipiscium sp.]